MGRERPLREQPGRAAGSVVREGGQGRRSGRGGLADLFSAGRRCAVCGQGLQGERQVAWVRSCGHSEEAGGGGPSAACRACYRDWGSLDSTGATAVNVSGGLRSNGAGGPSRAGRAGLCWSSGTRAVSGNLRLCAHVVPSWLVQGPHRGLREEPEGWPGCEAFRSWVGRRGSGLGALGWEAVERSLPGGDSKAPGGRGFWPTRGRALWTPWHRATHGTPCRSLPPAVPPRPPTGQADRRVPEGLRVCRRAGCDRRLRS